MHSLAVHYYMDKFCKSLSFDLIICSKLHWRCSSNTGKEMNPSRFCLSGICLRCSINFWYTHIHTDPRLSQMHTQLVTKQRWSPAPKPFVFQRSTSSRSLLAESLVLTRSFTHQASNSGNPPRHACSQLTVTRIPRLLSAFKVFEHLKVMQT